MAIAWIIGFARRLEIYGSYTTSARCALDRNATNSTNIESLSAGLS